MYKRPVSNSGSIYMGLIFKIRGVSFAKQSHRGRSNLDMSYQSRLQLFEIELLRQRRLVRVFSEIQHKANKTA